MIKKTTKHKVQSKKHKPFRFFRRCKTNDYQHTTMATSNNHIKSFKSQGYLKTLEHMNVGNNYQPTTNMNEVFLVMMICSNPCNSQIYLCCASFIPYQEKSKDVRFKLECISRFYNSYKKGVIMNMYKKKHTKKNINNPLGYLLVKDQFGLVLQYHCRYH